MISSHLAGKQDVSRLTLTLGKFSAKDIFDNNAYANDPRTQFMNWAFMANEAWDYPADALGYITGFAAELNQPEWALRYGFFQMPRVSNGTAHGLRRFLEAWGMVTELERRYTINSHPGTIRLLAYLNHAHMGSYQERLTFRSGHADITQTRAYRYKYGFGLNWEQEIVKNIGVFSRLGWSDGQNEAWVFSDVDCTATAGMSIKGEAWHGPMTPSVWRVVVNGLSQVHQEFFEAGGTGILAGDGRLYYGWEKILETYYDFKIWKTRPCRAGLSIYHRPRLQSRPRAGFRLRRAAALGVLTCPPHNLSQAFVRPCQKFHCCIATRNAHKAGEIRAILGDRFPVSDAQ